VSRTRRDFAEFDELAGGILMVLTMGISNRAIIPAIKRFAR